VPVLSIIIVSHNARDDLARCLESLHTAPPGESHEIVVVENASSDGSLDMTRRRWPGVRVIPLDRNVGFAAGSNVGIRATEGELLLLLNSDTVVPAGAVDHLTAALRADPNTAVVGPRILDEAGNPELSFGAMRGPWNDLLQHVRFPLGTSRRRVERLTSQPAVVDWITGACLLVRRSDAEAVNLLDERYFMYLEDVDFCAALRARGGRIRFLPSVHVVHRRGRSAATNPAAALTAYRRSQLVFYAKHYPGWLPWLRAYLRARGKLPVPTADTY